MNLTNIIYNERLGNNGVSYVAFCEKDEETNQNVYSILVTDNHSHTKVLLRSFTAKREKAIDFVETLVRNVVYPEFVNDVAEDYLLA